MTTVLGARRLRRNEPVQLVLIHGLFSSGAFWLPYLESFGAFQLTIVDVDYAIVLPSDGSLCEVAARVDALIGDKPAHLIAHSFGCWLGMHLQREFLSRSFICPTFATSSFNEAAFRAEIGRLTDADAGAIAQLIERAVAYKSRQLAQLRYRADDDFYLAEDDPFFNYVERVEAGRTHVFRGGHFDVSRAAGEIRSGLSVHR